jgi:hypothetical protein
MELNKATSDENAPIIDHTSRSVKKANKSGVTYCARNWDGVSPKLGVSFSIQIWDDQEPCF